MTRVGRHTNIQYLVITVSGDIAKVRRKRHTGIVN